MYLPVLLIEDCINLEVKNFRRQQFVALLWSTLCLGEGEHSTEWSFSNPVTSVRRCKVLQLEDQVHSSIHVWHDVIRLHQGRVEAEVPVAVEHGATVPRGQGHLGVRAVHPCAHQHRPAAGCSRTGQLVLPAQPELMVLGQPGRGSAPGKLGLEEGSGTRPGALLQVAVVQVGAIHICHQIVPAREKLSQHCSFSCQKTSSQLHLDSLHWTVCCLLYMTLCGREKSKPAAILLHHFHGARRDQNESLSMLETGERKSRYEQPMNELIIFPDLGHLGDSGTIFNTIELYLLLWEGFYDVAAHTIAYDQSKRPQRSSPALHSLTVLCSKAVGVTLLNLIQ